MGQGLRSRPDSTPPSLCVECCTCVGSGSTTGAGLGSRGFARRVVAFFAAVVLARVAAARRVVPDLPVEVRAAALCVDRARLAVVAFRAVDFGLAARVVVRVVVRVVGRGREPVAADVRRAVDRPVDRDVDREVD